MELLLESNKKFLERRENVMKKYVRVTFPFLIVLGIFMGIWSIYAYFEDSVTVTNHIKTGDVNIGISEYEMKNGREVSYKNPKVILPGDVISKIPRITNYAEPCWIRAKVTFENDMLEVEGFSGEHIQGISDKWVLRGNYYYYTDVLNYNESVDLFQAIMVPDTWTEAHNGQKMTVQIHTDAIQAANFTPDFTAMSPWGNEEIEICVHEENGTAACIKEEMELKVEFNGQAHRLLAVPDNFFHNIKRAMPGDVYQDEILLSNTTSAEAELFFKTEVTGQTSEQIDLLEQIELKISMGQKILFEGNLYSKALEKEISLGIYRPEENGKLSFEISVPKELTNEYALRDANVNWIFSVYEEDDDLEEKSNSGNIVQKNSVKTGDSSPIVLFIILAAVACTVVVVIIFWKKKVKKHEK